MISKGACRNAFDTNFVVSFQTKMVNATKLLPLYCHFDWPTFNSGCFERFCNLGACHKRRHQLYLTFWSPPPPSFGKTPKQLFFSDSSHNRRRLGESFHFPDPDFHCHIGSLAKIWIKDNFKNIWIINIEQNLKSLK